MHGTYIYFIFLHFFHPFIHCSRSLNCAYLSSPYLHLINPFSLPRFIPLSLTVLWSQFMFHNSYLFLRWQVVGLACHPTPKTGWPSYTPRHRVLVLIACYNLHGLQWDYSLPRSPHGESYFNICVQITFFGALYHVKNNAETTHFSLCVPSTPSIRFSRYLLQEFFTKSCWISSSFIKIGAVKA